MEYGSWGELDVVSQLSVFSFQLADIRFQYTSSLSSRRRRELILNQYK
jgi:hypothetical protein